MSIETSVLGAADDYLIHQTTEVIRHVATSDRRYFDRHFWTGHANNGDLVFLGGMGAYPNLGVIDAFFTISVGDQQITVRGSRELGTDRMDTTNVGPFSLTIIEGLKTFRLTAEETDGIAFDLTWTHCAPAFEEPSFSRRAFGRVVEQGVRFVQTGRWAGHIIVDGRRFEVDPENWWGSRDHSWCVRSLGFEDEPAGILQSGKLEADPPALWIWAPLQFEKMAIHFNIGERADGSRLLSTVRWMQAGDRRAIQLLTDAEHELVYNKTTNQLEGGEIAFRDWDNRRRVIKLTPFRTVYLFAATGYAVSGTPFGALDDWRHEKYMGENWSSVLRFDTSVPAVRESLGPTLHTSCRLELDSGEIGFAAFEHMVMGHCTYGFDRSEGSPS